MDVHWGEMLMDSLLDYSGRPLARRNFRRVILLWEGTLLCSLLLFSKQVRLSGSFEVSLIQHSDTLGLHG